MSQNGKMSKTDAAALAKKMIDNGKKYSLPTKKLISKKKKS